MSAKEFKVRDLVVSVGPASGAGTAGYFIDTPPTPLTPITPIAATTSMLSRLRHVDTLMKAGVRAEAAELDRIALDIGRAVVGAHIATRLGPAAQCTQEQQTCSAGQIISRYASEGLVALENADLDLLKRDAGVEQS